MRQMHIGKNAMSHCVREWVHRQTAQWTLPLVMLSDSHYDAQIHLLISCSNSKTN